MLLGVSVSVTSVELDTKRKFHPIKNQSPAKEEKHEGVNLKLWDRKAELSE